MISESIKHFDLDTLHCQVSNRYSLHQDIELHVEDDLLRSITRFGLFQPPLVQEEHGEVTLLCGARRIEALKRSGRETAVLCKVVTCSGPLEVLALILENQQQSGPLSVIMMARFALLLESMIPGQERSSAVKQLDIGSYGRIKRFKPLLALELPIRDAIHRGFIADSVGLLFSTMPVEERLFLTDLFEKLSLNRNKQKRLIELCRIITAQRGGTIKGLIEKTFPKVATSLIQANSPQVAGHLLQHLYELSHPLSVQAQSDFATWRKSIDLPANCELTHSQAFETDHVTLSVHFDNREAAARTWHQIKYHLT